MRASSDLGLCGVTAFGAVRVGFLKRHHFPLLLIQKSWQQKAINSNKYFRQDRFYLFCALRMQKHQLSKSEWIFPKRLRVFIFS